MKNFLRRLFVRNLRYKVIALILAVTIWYSVTERSFEDLTVSPVQKEFTHPENFLIHTDTLNTISLRLSCPQYLKDTYELSAKQFWVKIVLGPQSLSEAELVNAENYTMEVPIPLDGSMVHTRLAERESRRIFVEAITPRVLRVTVSLITKRVPIVAHFRGEPREGYVAGEPQLSLRSIELTGSQQALERVDTIDLQEIDLTGLSKEASTQVEIDREELQSRYDVRAVRDSDRKVYVTVPIVPAVQSKTVGGIHVVAVSAPEETKLTLVPESVEVDIKGAPGLLAKINVQDLTAEVDLSDLRVGEYFLSYAIRGLPDGAEITRHSVEGIDVTLEEKLPEPLVEEGSAPR